MGAIASQITSLTIVSSTVYSGTDQRKHESAASLAFVRGIHRGPVNSTHKWPVTRKVFPFDDVIMACVQTKASHTHTTEQISIEIFRLLFAFWGYIITSSNIFCNKDPGYNTKHERAMAKYFGYSFIMKCFLRTPNKRERIFEILVTSVQQIWCIILPFYILFFLSLYLNSSDISLLLVKPFSNSTAQVMYSFVVFNVFRK